MSAIEQNGIDIRRPAARAAVAGVAWDIAVDVDEPAGGLAPRFVQQIGNIINGLKQSGSTMLLVEQNMALALGVAERFYILRAGSIVRQGSSSELGSNYAELAQEYYR